MDELDEADRLRIHSLTNDPGPWEAMVRAEHERARTDLEARAVIEANYGDEDRARAFDRFARSAELRVILRRLDRCGVSRGMRLAELGGGAGYLAWALSREGFQRVDLVEPNASYLSGTGYLRARPDGARIGVVNDLAAWYADEARYDAIVTRNCVHHFPGIGFTAAAIRRKLVPGGRWLMLREWFADDARELYAQLRDHPYSQRYGLYEFPYPASHYVESVEVAGFSLESVVPAGYESNVLAGGVERDRWVDRAASRAFDAVLAAAPSVTARLYGIELFANRYLAARARRFTRPQAMLFRRRSL